MLALIITIILLLILTMVTYNFLIKGNLIGSAIDAKNKTNIAVEIEQIQVAYLNCELKYEEQNIPIDIDSFKESLNDPTVTVTRYEGRLEDGPQLVVARDESTGYALVEFTQTRNQYLIGLFEYDESTPHYTVTYNANGGYGGPASQRKIQGIDMTISYNVPTRDEYTFTGWALSSNSNTVTYRPGDKYKDDKDITLYAVWVEKEYNIEYELNGGTVTGNPTKYVKSDTIVLKNPTRVGYNFTGWTGTDLDGVTKYVVIENKTGNRKYTANWEICNYIIDDTKYAVTLEEALEQATNGSVIKVQRGAGENGKIEDNSTAIVTKQVTLDLQGSIIQITTPITVEESGNITVVDGGNEKEEYIGQITNTNGTVFINNGTMQLGNNDGAITYTPNLNGSTTAIINNGLLKFYDGQVTGRTAIQGENIETPTDYYAMATVGDNTETVTLQVLGDSVARIGYRYYTTLQNAVDGAPIGEYNTTTEALTINEKMQNNGTYYFESTDGKLKPTNKGVSSSVADSYIEFDLSELRSVEEYELIVNASVSSESNCDIGYATITNSTTAPNYSTETGSFMYISGTVAARDYSTKLKGGDIYYLHLGYRKDGSGNTGDDQVVINNIKFAGKTINVSSPGAVDIPTTISIPPEAQTKIEVLRNITEINEIVATNKNIVLDLNGYTIDIFKPITNADGKLEIIDSSAGKTGIVTNSATGTNSSNLASTIINSGTLKVSTPISTKNTYSTGIVNNGTVDITSEGTITLNGGYSYGIYNEGKGTVTNTGTITAKGNSSYGIYNKGKGIATNIGAITAKGNYSYGICHTGKGTATNTGTITMQNNSSYGMYSSGRERIENKGAIVVTFSASSSSSASYGMYNASTGEVENAGEITVKNTYYSNYSYGIYNSKQGKIIITGGIITASGNGIYNSTGTIEITGGSITSTNSIGVNNNSTGTIEITGGSITSTNSTGVYNNKGTVTIGEKGGEVNTTVPEIKGKTYGVDSTTAGTVNFYDGVVKGMTGTFNGEITEVEPDYNVIKEVDAEGYENGYLTKYVVAKIGETEYYNLQSAIDGAPTGEYNTTTKTITINEEMQNNGTYYFESTDGKLKPTNKGVSSSVADSYIEFDLSELRSVEEYELIVNASVSSESNCDIGYATITNSTTAPNYSTETGSFMYISGTVAARDYSTKLKGGDIYYLHLGYRKDGSGNTGDDQVVINNIKFAGKTINVSSPGAVDIPTTISIPPEAQTKIEVLRNITEINEIVATNKNIVLDLNGYTIDIFKPITNADGKLEIIDSSAGKTGIVTNSATGTNSSNLASTIINSGTLKVSTPISTKNTYSTGIVNNGTVDITSEGTITLNGGYSYGIYNEGKGTVTNTGTITAKGNSSYGIYNKGKGIATNIGAITAKGNYSYGICHTGKGTATNTGTITMQNNSSYGMYSSGRERIENKGAIVVTFSASSSSSASYGMYNASTGEVENAGEITVKNTYYSNYSYGIYNSKQGKIIITGGIITASGNGIYNSTGTIEITGGSITSTNSIGVNNNSTGTIEITGGSITSTNSTGVYNNKGTVTIGEKGGEVNTTVPEIKGKTYGVDSTTAGTINFYDGVVKGITGAFNGTVTELEPNYQILETTVDEYKCAKLLPIGEGIPSASIGSVNYFSLQDAIKSSQDGNVIVVRKNINLETSNLTVDADKNITINLNGYTISSQTDEATIKNEGTLIIKDTSANNTGKIENTTGAAIESKGTLIIGEDDGTINRDAPTIIGGSKGIVNNQGVLKIFDGNIIGIVAIEGDVTATPEGHEIVKIPILTKKKATLN